MRERRWPFSLALIGLVLAGTLPVIGLSAWLLHEEAQRERARLIEQVDELVVDVRNRLAVELRHAVHLAEVLSRNVALERGDLDTFAAEVDRHARADGHGVVIAVHDASGQRLISTSSRFDYDPWPARAKSSNLQFSVDTYQKAQISNLVIGKQEKNYYIYASVVVARPSSEPIIVNVAVPATRVRDAVGSLVPAPGGAIGIVDRAGVFVARSIRHEEFVGRPGSPALLDRMKEADSGNWIGVGLEGKNVLVSFAREQQSQWAIAASVSIEALEQPLREWFWQVGTLGALALIVGAGLAVLIGSALSRDLATLKTFATKVGGGQVEARPLRIREFNDISISLKNADKTISGQLERNLSLAQSLQNRVRNTLDIVNAVVNMTARGATDLKVYQTNLINRLKALARVHANVLNADDGRITMHELVASEFEAFGTNQVRFEGPDVRLAENFAADLGMALHELATNATKHGALSLSSGQVGITWELKQSTFVFAWRETGGSPTQAPIRDEFGSQFLQAVIVRKHRARLDLRHLQGGLLCIMIIPLNSVLKNESSDNTDNDKN